MNLEKVLKIGKKEFYKNTNNSGAKYLILCSLSVHYYPFKCV